MNALSVRRALAKKEREAELRKILMKQADTYLTERQNIEVENSRNNAMLHVLHTFVILNKVFGFGKVRLKRLYDALCRDNDNFKSSMDDGVSWTMVLNELDRIGIDLIDSEERKYLERVSQRMYEKNVNHYGEDEIDVIKENEKRFLKADV